MKNDAIFVRILIRLGMIILAGFSAAVAAAAPPSVARARELAAQILGGEWETALRASPPAAVREGTRLAEGRVVFNTPILLPLRGGGREGCEIVPYPWVLFEEAKGRLKATLALRARSRNEAQWSARLEVFVGPAPGNAAPLATGAAKFNFRGGGDSYGRFFGHATQDGEAELDLGPISQAGKPLSFRVGFDLLKTGGGDVITAFPGPLTLPEVALGPADRPEEFRVGEAWLERDGTIPRARIRVSYAAAARAKWRLAFILYNRAQRERQIRYAEIESAGTGRSEQERVERTLTLMMNDWADFDPEATSAWVQVEQTGGEALPGPEVKTVMMLDKDSSRLQARHDRYFRRSAKTGTNLRIGRLGDLATTLTAVGGGLKNPDASLTWRLLRLAPEGWTPPRNELEDAPGSLAWRDPATGQTWLVDAFHNERVGGAFSLMDAGVWRVMGMGRDGERGVFGISDPVRLEWASEPTTVTVPMRQGYKLTVSLAEAAQPEKVIQGWAVVRREDGLPIGAAGDWQGDDSMPIINTPLVLWGVPPGRYTASAGRAFEFYHDGVNKYPNFARRAGVAVMVEAQEENLATITLAEARLTSETVRRHWPWVLEGRVTDTAGKPLAGVTINTNIEVPMNVAPRHSGLVTTGPDGRYTLRLMRGVQGKAENHGLSEVYCEAVLENYYERNQNRHGHLAVAGRRPDYVPEDSPEARRLILPYQPFRLDFVMEPAARIHGRVLDKAGKPLVTQDFAFSFRQMMTGGPKIKADGSFEIDHAPCGEGRFWVMKAVSEPVEFRTPGRHEIELIYDDSEKTRPRLEVRRLSGVKKVPEVAHQFYGGIITKARPFPPSH